MRFFFAAAVSLFAGFALAGWVSIPANPEIKFWSDLRRQRDAEIEQSRAEYPNKKTLFFTGGSSCAFSIDPSVIEGICGLPTFNLGLPVSTGGNYLIHQALERCLPGDILVLCLEDDLLTDPKARGIRGASQMSFALSSVEGKVSDAAGGSTFGVATKFEDRLNFARPGARFLATTIAKKVTGRGYRYRSEDIRYHGRIETPIDEPGEPMGPIEPGPITAAGEAFLKNVLMAARLKQVDVVYSMPWQFTSKEAADGNRGKKLERLKSIQAIIPTLDDPNLGVSADKVHFADTGRHLTAQGSALNSRIVGVSLKKWLTDGAR